MAANRNQVLHKINQTWPDEAPADILRILDQYGEKQSEQGGARVQLAIIKVSEGNLERLPELVELAQRDYRDLLAWAEYPEEMRLSIQALKALSREEIRAIRQRDREQYMRWLQGGDIIQEI